MNDEAILQNTKIYSRIFWCFLGVHALFWTFAPAFFLPNFRPDTLEMIFVGKHWLLSSFKHPGFQGWVVQILEMLTGGAEFAPYLAAQIAVVLTIWCIWKMAQEFLSPQAALVAALAMLTYYYFNYESTLYNNRTFFHSFTALAELLTFYALKTNRPRFWIGTGIALAAGLYCNLATLLTILTIVAFMLVDRHARSFWRTSGPWLSTGICFALMIPYGVWLVRNHFPPITYAMNELSSVQPTFMEHIQRPIEFLLAQIPNILPVCLMLVPLLGIGWKWNVSRLWGHETKDRFLTFTILFPLLVTMGIALIKACKIRAALGSEIWIFLPVFLIYTAAQVNEDWPAIHRSLIWIGVSVFLFAVGSWLLVYFSPAIQGHASRPHYPGRAIAEEVQEIWREHFGDAPLVYVRGDDWPGMAAVIYGEKGMDVYSPLWTNEEEFRKKGGVLLWKTSEDETQKSLNFFANQDFKLKDGAVDPEWFRQFPDRIELPPMKIKPATPFDVPEVTVGIALVPPAGD